MSTWSSRTRLARDQRLPDGFIKPCLLTLADKVPTGPEWQFEVKHDGWRIIARVEAGREYGAATAWTGPRSFPRSPRVWPLSGVN